LLRKIVPYGATPRDRQFQPLRRKSVSAIGASLRRGWDELLWLIGRYNHITFYVWEKSAFSNKGDIGIREAVVEQLVSAFPDDDLSVTEIGWSSLDNDRIEAMHLCQTLHSAIFAINAGVQTVNVGYDVKNFAFFELLGLPAYCLAPDKSLGDAMFAQAEEALADQLGLARRRRIKQRKSELRHVLDGFFIEIGAIAKAGISAEPAAIPSSRPGRGP
jgi:hypothetical protein